MSRDVGDLLELPSDMCVRFQVAENSESPVGAHLKLSPQWKGKVSPGSSPQSQEGFCPARGAQSRAVAFGRVPVASGQTLVAQGCCRANARQEGMPRADSTLPTKWHDHLRYSF